MPVKLTYKDGWLAELEMDFGSKNAIGIHEMNEIVKTFETGIEKKLDLKAVLIKSLNKKYFAAGPEIKELKGMDRDGARYFFTVLGTVIRHITELQIPVICSINGIVSGIGLDIISACDFRLAESGAVFTDYSSFYGMVNPSNIALRLSFLIGAQKAQEILTTGKSFSSEELYRFNYLTQIYSSSSMDAVVGEFTEGFKKLSADSIRFKKQIFTDLWKNYVNSNKFPVEEMFSELLREGADWKKADAGKSL